MSRETLKNFLNTKAETAGQDSISFSHDKEGDRLRLDGNEDIEIDPKSGEKLLDLDNEGFGLLGDYVSFLTKEQDNIFPLSPGNERAASSNRGEFLVLAEEQGSENVYVTQGTDLANNLSVYSNSQFSNLSELVDKVGLENIPEKGHDLLKSIEGTGSSQFGEVTNHTEGDDNIVVQSVNREVLEKSRFGNISGKSVYLEENENESTHESGEKLRVNNKFGNHFDEEHLVRIVQLKELGASLLLKSSGYDPSGDSPGASSNTEDLDDQISKERVNSSLSYSAGAVLDTDNLRAKNAKGFPQAGSTDESIRAGRGEFISSNRKSFGTTYNSSVHFNGKNQNVLKVQAAIALQALKVLADQIYDTVVKGLINDPETGDIMNAIEDDYTSAIYGHSMYGKSRSLYNLKLDYVKMNILVPTIYPYKTAFERGIRVILSNDLDIKFMDPKPNLPTSLGNERRLAGSPGFWLSVSKSIVNSYQNTVDSFTSTIDELISGDTDSEEEALNNLIKSLSSNNIIRFMNAMATVGDASLQAYGGGDITAANLRNRPRNVDSIPDSPGTRVGKSRKDAGYRSRQLAWSQNDVPSMYLLPINQLRAASRLDKTISGPNPFTAMFGSELIENTYTSINADGTGARIPAEVVKSLENQLEAEYVPFYIQDLRTNEIISFHAFLDQLSDTISPNYSSVSGYGRLDPVRIYESTTRTIQLGFTLLATSKEDFNSMWYKINKLVTLLYPQWTKGTLVGTDVSVGLMPIVSKFIQPHSQVLGATPLVRLRVGDVIKSNYSRFNLAKLFGIGDGDVAPLAQDVFGSLNGFIPGMREFSLDMMNKIKDVSAQALTAVYGSPIQFLNILAAKKATNTNILTSKVGSAIKDIASNNLKNGFVNPLALSVVTGQLVDPDVSLDNESGTNNPNFFFGLIPGFKREGLNSMENRPVYLKANYNQGYKIVGQEKTGKRIFIPNACKVHIVGKTEIKSLDTSGGSPLGKSSSFVEGSAKTKTLYKVKIVDFALPSSAYGLELLVEFHDLYQIPNDTLVNTVMFGLALAAAGGVISPTADFFMSFNAAKGFANSKGLEPLVDIIRHVYQSEESMFMDPFNNPYTRAYESTAGRGLAGTIGTVTFNWLDDFNWEIDHNSRAPMGCKITFDFNVIHDIPPGLDHSGYNRAPLYNVGDIMKDVSGDVYESFTKKNEFEFRKSSGKGTKIEGE